MLVTLYKLKLYMVTSTGQYFIDHKHNMVIQYIITKELYIKFYQGRKRVGGYKFNKSAYIFYFFIFLFDSSNQQISKYYNFKNILI